MTYKVCYVMKRYLTPFIEGYTIGSKNLIKASRQTGVNATVFSAEPSNCQKREPGTYISRTLFAEKLHADDLVTASYAFFLSIFHDYNIIHFLPNLAGDIYALFTRPKIRKETKTIVHFAHPYHPYIDSPFSRFRLSFLCKKASDYIFCTNSFLVKYFQQNTGVQESRIFCIPFPIDTNKYKPLKQKEKLRENHGVSGEHVIAFVGQIEPVRGVFVLLRAFNKVVKHVDNVQLVISSPRLSYERLYVSALKRMVKRLKLQEEVVLLDPQHCLEEIYNLADIVVFPYTQPYYYMDPPLTLFEAMASGALVVASDVGIVNELVVDGQNGKLTKPRDVEALTEALVNGIRNVDYYNLFGVKARETIISKFSMNKIGVTLTKIYSKILEDMPK